MKKLLAALAAEIAFVLTRLLARRVSDAALARNLRRLKKLIDGLQSDPAATTPLGDLIKIFDSPDSAALARRLILEARPAQLKATVRGAIG
jgi:hypothetical protein